MTVGLPLMKNVFTSLAKSVLITLGLTATAATDGTIQKKIYVSNMTILIIPNEEIKDSVKHFKESDLSK